MNELEKLKVYLQLLDTLIHTMLPTGDDAVQNLAQQEKYIAYTKERIQDILEKDISAWRYVSGPSQ